MALSKVPMTPIGPITDTRAKTPANLEKDAEQGFSGLMQQHSATKPEAPAAAPPARGDNAAGPSSTENTCCPKAESLAAGGKSLPPGDASDESTASSLSEAEAEVGEELLLDTGDADAVAVSSRVDALLAKLGLEPAQAAASPQWQRTREVLAVLAERLSVLRDTPSEMTEVQGQGLEALLAEQGTTLEGLLHSVKAWVAEIDQMPDASLSSDQLLDAEGLDALVNPIELDALARLLVSEEAVDALGLDVKERVRLAQATLHLGAFVLAQEAAPDKVDGLDPAKLWDAEAIPPGLLQALSQLQSLTAAADPAKFKTPLDLSQGVAAAVTASAVKPLNRVQWNTVLPQSNTEVGSMANAGAGQLQLAGNEQEQNLGDLLRRGFIPPREALAPGVRIQDDQGLKHFSQIMSQMGAVRSVAPVSTADAATQVMAQARPLDVPLGGKEWGAGVGERIQWMINKGLDQAQIRLNPQHLGPLEIRISLLKDQANISILAQHAMTREAVEASLPRLREMFQDANLNLGNVDVGQREKAPNRDQAQRGKGADGRGFGEAVGDVLAVEEELTVGTAPRQKLGLISEYA